MKSLKSLCRRMGRKILRSLRKLNRNEIIVISTIVVGVILTITIVLVLRNTGKGPKEVSSLDISVQEDDDPGQSEDQTSEEITLTETASAETKVESTEETTILVTKENAQKGYMNRCVFLGDSRTVAMVNYGLINDDSALAQIGISHPSFAGNTFINNAGKQYTLKTYLASHQAPVIYIALGVNGINDPSEDHYKKTFVQLIDSVMEQAPNSNIVLMSIGPVNDNGMYKKTVQNSWIVKYNDFLLNTAKEKHIFYLDISEVLTGSDGQVRPEYNGGDGLHYSGSGCQAIFDYIVSHPVPGISDEGEYNVKYIKPNPNNTKVTMDDGSGIDESKLQELMNMMMEETPTPTATPAPTQATPSPEELKRQEEERKKKEEEEAKKALEEEEERKKKKKQQEEEEERRRRQEQQQQQQQEQQQQEQQQQEQQQQEQQQQEQQQQEQQQQEQQQQEQQQQEQQQQEQQQQEQQQQEQQQQEQQQQEQQQQEQQQQEQQEPTNPGTDNSSGDGESVKISV